MLIFIPATGILTGSSILSLYFNDRGYKNKNGDYLRFSKDLTQKLVLNFKSALGLIILPLITITIIYSVFFYRTNFVSIYLLFISNLFISSGVILIYFYKLCLNKRHETNGNPERTEMRFGISGVILMLIGIFLFSGSVTSSLFYSGQNSYIGFVDIIFSLSVWINFIFLTSFSFAVTGISVLYFFIKWEGGIAELDEGYLDIITKSSLKLSITFTFILTLLAFINILILPVTAMTDSVFYFSILVMLFLLLTINVLYAIWRNSEYRFSYVAFFMIFIALLFIVLKEQTALSSSLKNQFAYVNLKAEEYHKEKSLKTTVVAEINAEEIYNTKCSACHRFERKLVGPPYDETVPKYKGDIKKLSQYIYNPVKIYPDYPAMPNQGLKMKEAEAVAKFLLEKVGNK